MKIQLLIDMVNEQAERNELFWLAGLIKETKNVLKPYNDKLHKTAQFMLQTYLDEDI